jgi:hypothetical protein
MSPQSRLEKNSKQAGLVCLASVFLCHCVDFAPDLAPSAGGRDAGGGAGWGGTGEFTPLTPERSVIESNPDALAYFNLERVLASATGELGADVYRAYALSFAERSEGASEPGPRCDDEQPSSAGLSTMNGFPLPCPAEAANLYSQLPAWKPLAVTNRFDLAPIGGENCGEQHLSFFFDTIWAGQPEHPGRAYLNFAAVIVNPAPERGLEGCRPLLDFWASLSQSEYDAPDRRARAFELAFLGSSLMPSSSTPTSRELAALSSSGFQSLVSPAHFGHLGRLQLLYLGDFGSWYFFEHALVSRAKGFVERLPLGQTLSVAALVTQHPKREQCIDALLASAPGLMSEDVNLMRMDMDPACFAATNTTDDTTLTAGLVSGPLSGDLRERLDEHMKRYYSDLGMWGVDLAKRAVFAGTCVGCHVLGDSPWANPSSFSHVSRDLLRPCSSIGPDSTRRCYARSPLLNTIFIPHWTKVLEGFLQRPGAYGPLPSGMPSTTAIDGAPLTAHYR